jgi:hypothetical protein
LGQMEAQAEPLHEETYERRRDVLSL